MPSKFSVRVTVSHRRSTQESKSNPRDAFWQPIIAERESKSNFPADEIEQRFSSSFGGLLSNNLVKYLDKQIAGIEASVLPKDYPDLRDFLHFPEKYFFERIREVPSAYFGSVSTIYSKIAEAKSELFRQHPLYRQLVEKRTLAQQVLFTIDNISYGSLGYNVSFAPVEKVATVFDSNFDVFKAFLDAYIPDSFKDSIGYYNGEDLAFQIDASPALSNSFQNLSYKFPQIETQVGNPMTNGHSKMDKAKWYWSVANASLVVPVILSLVVLYFAFQMFTEVNRQQAEALKPVLDSQTQLIKHYQDLTKSYDLIQQALLKKALNETEPNKPKSK